MFSTTAGGGGVTAFMSSVCVSELTQTGRKQGLGTNSVRVLSCVARFSRRKTEFDGGVGEVDLVTMVILSSSRGATPNTVGLLSEIGDRAICAPNLEVLPIRRPDLRSGDLGLSGSTE